MGGGEEYACDEGEDHHVDEAEEPRGGLTPSIRGRVRRGGKVSTQVISFTYSTSHIYII